MLIMLSTSNPIQCQTLLDVQGMDYFQASMAYFVFVIMPQDNVAGGYVYIGVK